MAKHKPFGYYNKKKKKKAEGNCSSRLLLLPANKHVVLDWKQTIFPLAAQ